ncbi:UNVERIFIED_CONTAM: hypothetical protein Sindi_3018900, partial [Sesamum indicum]
RSKHPCCSGGKEQRERKERRFTAVKRGIGRGSTHNFSSSQVLERSRRLNKDKMIQGSVMTRSLMWNRWDLST